VETESPHLPDENPPLAEMPADAEMDEREEAEAIPAVNEPLLLTVAHPQARRPDMDEPRDEHEPVQSDELAADLEAMPARPSHAVVYRDSKLSRRDLHEAPEVEPAAVPRAEKPSSDSMPAAEPADPLPARTEAVGGLPVDPAIPLPAIPAEPIPSVPAMTPAPSASPAVQSPAPAAPPAPVPMAQEAEFAEANHPAMVSAIHAQALPDGGRMQIRLDPPQLGSLEIHVEVRDGVLTASFQTSNDEATRLLSHSLSRLKHSLESQGISIDRLHVQQMPRNEHASADQQDGSPRQQQPQEQAGQQEQQRREMLRRLWRRVAGEQDPLDLWA
jgi:flagellar hook-length control protein FliK